MNEDLIIGIDLGTTNSLVGVVDSGFPLILADEDGERLTPSVVTYLKDGSAVTGREAVRLRKLEPERTISSVKRFIGRPFDQISTDQIAASDYKIQPASIGIEIPLSETQTTSPIEVSAEILRRLKTVAETALGHKVSRAVVTVPAYFSNSQREATKSAAESAGLTVERVLNEPTAAALAYGLDKLDEQQTVAVYDLGGGTFDLSILQMKEGLFEVVSTAGDTQLGGDDLDLVIAKEIQRRLKLDELTTSESSRIRVAACEAKESLSSSDTHLIRLPFFRGNESFETEISQSEIEAIMLPVIERTRSICRRAFAEAQNKGVDSIDHLILVGGSTRIPLVRRSLEEWFEIIPNLSQHPDEAVALGAAIQAGILCGRVREVLLVDVTPLSLGIETFGGLMNVIIPRNSTIPAKAGEMFTNAVANQEIIAIRVLQGEREMARDNWLLGEIEIPFQPGPKGNVRVGVQFEIDHNGILEVLSRNTATDEDHILKIESSAVDVDDSSVERMVSESIDHAFDDMNERIWTEARMKSEELLPAVESALELVGSKLPEDELAEIHEAAALVKGILTSDLKDVPALKQANDTLDEATQTLAALLVEAAFK
ncbi:MAG: molecular chaperone DnaK [Verrucomicrobiales bacterium]|nr:molecular chaperone DnaK [Verrucomicrobiales bacterium]